MNRLPAAIGNLKSQISDLNQKHCGGVLFCGTLAKFMKKRLAILEGGILVAILSSALSVAAQTTPRFDSYQELTNKEISLRLSVPTGFNNRMAAATNLPQWSALPPLAGTNTSLQHTDSAAP